MQQQLSLAARLPAGRSQGAHRARRAIARCYAQASGVGVKFEIKYGVRFGEHLCLVGSTDKLGQWDVAKGVEMQWTEGDVWRAELDVSPSASNQEVEYKYVVRKGDDYTAVAWQPGDNYTLKLPAGGAQGFKPGGATLLVEDTWDGEQRNVKVHLEAPEEPAHGQAVPAAEQVAAAAAAPEPAYGQRQEGSLDKAITTSGPGSASEPGSASGPGSVAYTAEQAAFLERKKSALASLQHTTVNGTANGVSVTRARERAIQALPLRPRSRSPSPVQRSPSPPPPPLPSRASPPRPAPAAPVASSNQAKPASPPAPPAAAADAAKYSQEQLEFLKRKSASPPPPSAAQAEAKVRSASAPRSASPTAPSATRQSPSPVPAADGLSPEQQEFLRRKAAASPAPSAAAAAPVRGRSASPRPSFRPRAASPAPAAAAAAAPSTSAPAASSNELSPEQLAFLQRKANASPSPSAAATSAPQRGRSASPRPSFRPRSPAAAPAAAAASRSPSPGQSTQYTPEQLEFLRRKGASPAPSTPAAASNSAAPPTKSPVAPSDDGAKYSPEQLAFLQRKQGVDPQGSNGNGKAAMPAAAATGRSPSPAPAPAPAASVSAGFVTPEEAAKYSPEQLAFLARKRSEDAMVKESLNKSSW